MKTVKYYCDLCGREYDGTGDDLLEFFSWDDDKTEDGSTLRLANDKMLIEIKCGRAYKSDHTHIPHICIFCLEKAFDREVERITKGQWVCLKCGQSNSSFAKTCGRCEDK